MGMMNHSRVNVYHQHTEKSSHIVAMIKNWGTFGITEGGGQNLASVRGVDP